MEWEFPLQMSLSKGVGMPTPPPKKNPAARRGGDVGPRKGGGERGRRGGGETGKEKEGDIYFT